jgi:hypothetical protein
VRGGGTNVPSLYPSELPDQPSEPSDQPSKPSNQPWKPDPATDDTPPPMMDDSDDSNSDGDEVVITNSRRHPSTTTMSGREVRAPNRMNLNTMNVKELNAIKAKKSQEIKKKLSNQNVRARVLNHQLISSIKWTQLKSCMMTGHLWKLLENLHQDTDQELGLPFLGFLIPCSPSAWLVVDKINIGHTRYFIYRAEFEHTYRPNIPQAM